MQLKLYDKPFVCDKLSLSTSLSAKLQFFLHNFNEVLINSAIQ